MARRTFFSFYHRPDVWRAWNVRNSWVVVPDQQIDAGFFDSSVFEAKKSNNYDALKAFLRDALKDTSVTCVLAGQETWTRPWVRYEIVRSVVKGNGILTVDIHAVKDKDGNVVPRGSDPLASVGVYKASSGILFAEWKNGKWVRYEDYTLTVPASDLWFAAPKDDNVVQLSNHCMRYDFIAQNGRNNIGGWIETAAKMAGR